MYAQSFRQGDDGSIGPIGSTRMPDAVTHHTCIKTQTEYELSLILKEIRFITDQVSFLVLGIYIKKSNCDMARVSHRKFKRNFY